MHKPTLYLPCSSRTLPRVIKYYHVGTPLGDSMWEGSVGERRSLAFHVCIPCPHRLAVCCSALSILALSTLFVPSILQMLVTHSQASSSSPCSAHRHIFVWHSLSSQTASVKTLRQVHLYISTTTSDEAAYKQNSPVRSNLLRPPLERLLPMTGSAP